MGRNRSSRWTPDFEGFFFVNLVLLTIQYSDRNHKDRRKRYMENNLTELIFCRHSICRGVDCNYKEIYEKKM